MTVGFARVGAGETLEMVYVAAPPAVYAAAGEEDEGAGG